MVIFAITSIKSFYIENLGCAKNQVDAEIMMQVLVDRGLNSVERAEEADLLIVNTCGFIKPAKIESIETTLELRRAFPDKLIVMAGCLAQRYSKELDSELPEIDGFAGNRAPSRIDEILPLLEEGGGVRFFPDDGPERNTRSQLLSSPRSAYVKISEGCGNNCSYCAIPLIRGPLRSRSEESVLEEISTLLSRNFFEINLIAQDLASFGNDRGEEGLISLLQAISRLSGTFWIRLLYIHPDHFPWDIVDLCRRDERIVPYFDLPFQHASGKILKAMNRRGNEDTYLRLVETIREKLPPAVIRSTFLVGFPGEDGKDFEKLLRFVEKARPDWMGTFAYSPEEDTPAYKCRPWTHRLPLFRNLASAAAERRQRILEQRGNEIMSANLERFVGKSCRVLVEERIRGEDLVLARAYFQAPEVDGLIVVHDDGSLSAGDTPFCTITKRNGIDLEGRLETVKDPGQEFEMPDPGKT